MSRLAIDAALVVVSDIHMQSCDDARAQKLLGLLEAVSRGAVEYLVFLGDIFDFCLGSHPFFQSKFEKIGEALERVVGSGTRVIYIEGNHEFRLRDLPWKGVEIVENGTRTVQLSDGIKVQMAHGDMIYSHRRYKAFRWLVKSSLVTGVARLLPGAWMDGLATKGSEVSRSADQYRTIQHDRILKAVDSWLEQGEGDYGIFGHFHVPYAEPRRDGRKGGVYSVESWDAPNVLAFRLGAFYRMNLSRGSFDWQLATPLIRGPLQILPSQT